jgi:NAD(P)-dependent dehydrogenase (short-subunit alcohol dehydrogenase family)
MASLTNKTALVTGASRGIGRATAQALASAGAHVIIHYRSKAAEADALNPGQPGVPSLPARKATGQEPGRPCPREDPFEHQ